MPPIDNDIVWEIDPSLRWRCTVCKGEFKIDEVTWYQSEPSPDFDNLICYCKDCYSKMPKLHAEPEGYYEITSVTPGLTIVVDTEQ